MGDAGEGRKQMWELKSVRFDQRLKQYLIYRQKIKLKISTNIKQFYASTEAMALKPGFGTRLQDCRPIYTLST